VVRAENSSAGKNLGRTSNDKIGNPYLKWAFSEIGHSMIRNYPEIQAWYRNQADLHGSIKAHARMRHKIAVAVYYMLKNNVEFDLERFLGRKTSINQAENPAHNRTEKSEPICVIENPPVTIIQRKAKGKSRRKAGTLTSGRTSLRTTGMHNVSRKNAIRFG
jgi:hypothetical protein